jgi:hypothetical protein
VRYVVLIALAFSVSEASAATASGRNWRLAIESVGCEQALLTIGARVDYLGPKGVVEAPVIRLVDAKGQAWPPKGLVWKSGPRDLAQWLASAGLANVQVESVGEFRIRFDAQAASGALKLEFGDLRAFAVTREKGCASPIKPAELQAPKRPPAARAGSATQKVYRNTYPCTRQGRLHVTEARYPPYLPKQLLFFGRGYLPNVREIDLLMGKAPAQSYSYLGVDSVEAVEAFAARAVLADFPAYAKAGHFVFNWGSQSGQSGNEAYSVALYDVRACPG